MTFLELSRTRDIFIAEIYEAPVWVYMLYDISNEILPFMSETDVYKIPRYNVIGMLTDTVPLLKIQTPDDAQTLNYVRNNERTFCQIEDKVYFHMDNHNPVFIYNYLKLQMSIGLTNGETVKNGDKIYFGGIDFHATRKDNGDSLATGKMKFNSDSVVLDNSRGDYDDIIEFIGNSVSVRTETEELYQYYVRNAKYDGRKATLTLGDRRERLAQKVPGKYFTVEEFPYMQNPAFPAVSKNKSDKLGEAMIDAYGYCNEIKAVCVDEYYIYDLSAPDGFKQTRTFYVARKITRITKVEVKMTQPEDDKTEVWTDQTNNAKNITDTTFTMDKTYCMPLFWEGEDIPEIFDIRVTGYFGDADKPKDIIYKLLNHYCEIPADNYNYDLSEMSAELDVLANVGIVFDEQIDVFEAIERLQNSSTYAFQFMVKYDRFTARRDNIEREVSKTIRAADIINPSDIAIDLKIDNYATSIDIGYARRMYSENEEHLVDDSLYLLNYKYYRLPKTYSASSSLTSLADAQLRAAYLVKFYSVLRPYISGINLWGDEWLNARIYDIVNIDLSLEAPDIKSNNRLIGLSGVIKQTTNNHTLVVHRDSVDEIVAGAREQLPVKRARIGKIKMQILELEVTMIQRM